MKSGVPQGSALGPLFLIFINDLENDIISQIKFLADFTMFSANLFINHELQLISEGGGGGVPVENVSVRLCDYTL